MNQSVHVWAEVLKKATHFLQDRWIRGGSHLDWKLGTTTATTIAEGCVEAGTELPWFRANITVAQKEHHIQVTLEISCRDAQGRQILIEALRRPGSSIEWETLKDDPDQRVVKAEGKVH